MVHDKAYEEESQVANWYAGKNLLITGATGFMGKVLVAKLLRSCANINSIYLLIRPKKGLDPFARKEQYFKCMIFDDILAKNPYIKQKIQVIKSDLLEPELGLSQNDIKVLTDNVDMIFHCAANVRFDQPLRPMVEMNVCGTLKVLELAQKMSNLKAFVHVSTSYCQCNESVLEERAYSSTQSPYEIIEMVNKMNDKSLAAITPQLLNGLPNTYAYSKALSEDLLNRFGHKFPIVITRPSIVTAAISEPLPGWIEGVNGPTGLMIGAARGVIRSMHCNPDYTATVIPVDKAVNGMIIAGYDRAHSKSDQVTFINLCISNKSLISWGQCIENGKRFFYETPLSYALWFPDGSIKRNYYHHMLCVFLFHYLPAYFIDFWLWLFGQKPFLIKVQTKISTGLKLLQYYTTKEWDFRNDRFLELNSKLNSIDRQEFEMCANHINWEAYIRTYILGMRTFILGENDSTIPRARKLLRRLHIIDRLTTYGFFILVIWFLWINVDRFVVCGEELFKSSLQIIYSSRNSTI